jgi:hypothetical protein
VQPHPKNDELVTKLDIVTISGKINVANRPDPDSPRYQVGDYAIVLTENLILPELLLKHLDLWDKEKGKGYLAGSKGDRTKSRKIQGVLSEVILCKISPDEELFTGFVFLKDNIESVNLADNLGVKDYVQ